ncbi:hypothetical protein FD755_010457 [Muntiacus reevesi]|uniref:G-protein coupled receptors family 1 profile domain-containing protein n=1 Tax=Muntiacus reevesi TaxID=9886 RepID=A0A5N3XY66_MUNRE|nr:hypothetical protein FD755_010457 [Muntiacus reevesi]
MEVNSSVNKFVLLGLTQNLLKDKVVFVIFLLLYLATPLVNVLILNVFFLFYLSFVDACFSTTTAPRLIVDSISEKKVVSFNGCMTQIFAFHFFGCMGILVLALLSFDRHVAICKLLQFTAIMSQCVCGSLVKLAWVGACIHSSAQILLVLRLPFCGPNVIDHYFCDTQPLLKLAYTDTYVISLLIVSPLLKLICTDTFVTGILVVANGGLICAIVFLLLLVSYGVILHSLKNLRQEGRQKALQTCGSHITVVVCFFVLCIFIFVRPGTTFHTDKSLTVFYTIKTPMLKPLILRNSEMTNAMNQLW